MTTRPTDQTETLPEIERWRQARIQRLLKELNANSIQRSAIEEELRELGHEVKRRNS